MRNALHPFKEIQVNVPSYVREFGNDIDSDAERVRCPVCHQRMYPVAPSSPNAIGHFSHMPKTGFCPTKIKAAAPYANFPPLEPDLETSKTIKRYFKQHWEKHFVKLNWIVKGLAYTEFIDTIKRANKSRIWEYAKLEEYQLPYVFATLTDFSPQKSYTPKGGTPTRKYYFRCWFDASVQRYDDLWIHRTSPLQFWRAWYQLQEGKRKPEVEDLIDAYSMNLESDFLLNDYSPSPYVVKQIDAWLDKNFKDV